MRSMKTALTFQILTGSIFWMLQRVRLNFLRIFGVKPQNRDFFLTIQNVVADLKWVFFLQKGGGIFFRIFQYFGSNSSKNLKQKNWYFFCLYFDQKNHFEYQNFFLAPKLDLQIKITVFFGFSYPPHSGLFQGLTPSY